MRLFSARVSSCLPARPLSMRTHRNPCGQRLRRRKNVSSHVRSTLCMSATTPGAPAFSKSPARRHIPPRPRWRPRSAAPTKCTRGNCPAKAATKGCDTRVICSCGYLSVNARSTGSNITTSPSALRRMSVILSPAPSPRRMGLLSRAPQPWVQRGVIVHLHLAVDLHPL